MRGTTSAYAVSLIIAASCLTSDTAYGRESLATKIQQNMFSSFSRSQEAPDKVAELEAKFEKLQEVVNEQQDRITELEHDIDNGTVPSNLADQVNSNAAAIANLAGMELLEDHFTVTSSDMD